MAHLIKLKDVSSNKSRWYDAEKISFDFFKKLTGKDAKIYEKLTGKKIEIKVTPEIEVPEISKKKKSK